jgi:hypothetical protein
MPDTDAPTHRAAPLSSGRSRDDPGLVGGRIMSKGGAKWQELPSCDVARLCSYISDDGTIASYFRIPREVVQAVRAGMKRPIPEREPVKDRNTKHGDPISAGDTTTRHKAACGSEQLCIAIQKTGQTIPPAQPKRRLTFDEQLALVASGRARIVDLGRA